MEFTNTLKKEMVSKYLDMLNGSTEKPYITAPHLESENAYSQKRNSYYARLEKERDAFNDACETVQKTKDTNGQLAQAELANKAMEYWNLMLKEYHCKSSKDLVNICQTIKNNHYCKLAIQYARESGIKDVLDPMLEIVESQEITAQENRNIKRGKQLMATAAIMSVIVILLHVLTIMGVYPIRSIWFSLIPSNVGKILAMVLPTVYLIIAPLIGCMVKEERKSWDKVKDIGVVMLYTILSGIIVFLILGVIVMLPISKKKWAIYLIVVNSIMLVIGLLPALLLIA